MTAVTGDETFAGDRAGHAVTSSTVGMLIDFSGKQPATIAGHAPSPLTALVGSPIYAQWTVFESPVLCYIRYNIHSRTPPEATAVAQQSPGLAAGWHLAKRAAGHMGGAEKSRFLPVTAIARPCRLYWGQSSHVVSEFAFGFACQDENQLSAKHAAYLWPTYAKTATGF